MNIKIGHSWDVHQLTFNRSLILGGVVIPYERGLKGHSDADVLCHVVAEAILGALALGDLGTLFPDTNPLYQNIDSTLLVLEVVKLMKSKAYRVGNIDITIHAQKPQMKPYILDMRQNVARLLEVKLDCVSIKATTHEKLGFIGEGLAIAAEAVVLLFKDI